MSSFNAIYPKRSIDQEVMSGYMVSPENILTPTRREIRFNICLYKMVVVI